MPVLVRGSYVAKDIVAEYKKFDNDPSKFLKHIGKHSRTGEVSRDGACFGCLHVWAALAPLQAVSAGCP